MTSSDTSPMGAAAVELARAGWPVLPVDRRTKLPLARHAKDSGTTDLATVERWWWKWPDANVAARVPDGLVVLDVDPRAGGRAALLELELEHGRLPATLTVLTGGEDRGQHFYFLRPGGQLSQSRLPAGLDLRIGGRHYCVLPPSLHVSGRPYVWADTRAPVAMPWWLASLIRAAEPPIRRPTTSRPPGRGYGEAALWGEARRVRTAPVGNRNDQLNRSAFALGQLVGAGLVDRQVAAHVLVEAAVTAGLGHSAVGRTIRSGLDAGEKKPRAVAS